MMVGRILCFHVKIFQALGLLPIEVSNNSIVMTRKSRVLCMLLFLTLNMVHFYALISVLLHPERIYWKAYSRTANIYRVLQMLATFIVFIVIHYWLIFHCRENIVVLKETFRMLRSIQSIGLRTTKYNLRCRILYFEYYVKISVFLTSSFIMLLQIHKYKVNPNLVVEGVEFSQRFAAIVIIEYCNCCGLALSYAVTCINKELSKFARQQKNQKHLNLASFRRILKIWVTLEPICDELNRTFGLPIAIVFCVAFTWILNTNFYAYIVFFTDWNLAPFWRMYVALGASIGLVLPVVIGLIHMCDISAGLAKQVSYLNPITVLLQSNLTV